VTQQVQEQQSAHADEGNGNSVSGSMTQHADAVQQHPQQQQQQQPPEHEGLLARCVHQLFASIDDRRGDVQCSMTISCTEVYNETVTDLLARNKTQQLQVSKLSHCHGRIVTRAAHRVHVPL